jgi:hypothetical protein
MRLTVYKNAPAATRVIGAASKGGFLNQESMKQEGVRFGFVLQLIFLR